MHFRRYVTQEQLDRALKTITERINMSASQSDVDALTAQVTQVAADLGTAQTALQAEIDALAAANPSIDLSALQAAVAPLDGAVIALQGLTPTAPQAEGSGDSA